MWTLFKYLYRDASNYKAFGAVAVAGQFSEDERANIRQQLESGQFFIAEQIGVPPLYDQLYRWSDGPISDDHCWHEFERFEEVGERPSGMIVSGSAADFVARISAVKEWQLDLSPHFAIGAGENPLTMWASRTRSAN